MRRTYFGIILAFWSVLSVMLAPVAQAKEPDDVIARVGDQTITFSEIDIMINSSAIVGLTLPAFGSPERNTARMTILDKMVSANLLYLDALKKGADKNAVYQHDVQRFSDTMLGSLYKEKYMVGDLTVTEEEVQDFFNNNIEKGTELTDDVKLGIESVIRKNKFKSRTADMRERLREGTTVVLEEENLDPEGDEKRKASMAVARVDQEKITWGEIKIEATHPSKNSREKRVEVLNRIIDQRIMTKKAKEAGMEQDPVYLARVKEFKKVRLVNIYRGKLVEEYSPTDQEIKEYFEKNKDKIVVREVRKVQMVVLKTKKEAEEVKKKIDTGEITIYEAALEYSIDPNAKKTLGEIGWVSRGTGFPELDALTFSLEPEKLGGPVESPAGWHLVKVLDIRDAMHQSIEDEGTRKKTRRMIIHEKQDQYVVNLRKNVFKVEVYEDVIQRLMKEEAERFKAQKEDAMKKSGKE